MNYKIVKCINNPKDFSKKLFEDLGIGIEIQDFASPNLLDNGWENRLIEYKDLTKNFKGVISLHGSFLDLNPSSPDNKIREITWDRYIHSLNIAKKLKAKYIVFHSQINPWLKDPEIKIIKDKRAGMFWRKVINNYDIKILIENVFEDDPKELVNLIDEIDHPNIKICLDIGHANLSKETQIKDWFDILGDRIEYIHLHWNNEVYDEHNMPTDFNLKYFNKLLKEYEISPIIALEYEVEDVAREVDRVREFSNKN